MNAQSRYFVLSLLGGACMASPANAIFNITSTDIKKGQFAFETRNRWDEDDRASKDGFKNNALKAEYGVTDRWAVEMLGFWQDIPQHGYLYTSTEFENKFRFYNPGDYWLDFALKLSYEWKVQDNKADQVKAKFLFQKNLGKWAATANVNVSKEIGKDTVKEAEMSFAWRTKYKLDPHFEPGFEYYANVGELVNIPSRQNQQHRIGPMFFGELAPGLKYQAGYLFGMTKAAEDGSFKLFLRYEFAL